MFYLCLYYCLCFHISAFISAQVFRKRMHVNKNNNTTRPDKYIFLWHGLDAFSLIHSKQNLFLLEFFASFSCVFNNATVIIAGWVYIATITYY